jgi:hypothetical protein
MDFMDTFWDPDIGYLRDVSAITPLHHETGSSMWYAAGLLARNKDGDVENAERIIRNILENISRMIRKINGRSPLAFHCSKREHQLMYFQV